MKKRYIIGLCILMLTLFSACGSISNSKSNVKSKMVNSDYTQGKLIKDRYFEDENDMQFLDSLYEKNAETFNYNNYEFSLKSYIYDKETKIAYVEFAVNHNDIWKSYADIADKNSNYDVFDIRKFGVNGDEFFMFHNESTETFGMIAEDYEVNENEFIVCYCLVECDGKLSLFDCNEEKVIKEFQLRDTVNDCIEVADGIFVSPIGAYISCTESNGYSNVDNIGINLICNNDETIDIFDMYDWRGTETDTGAVLTYRLGRPSEYKNIKDVTLSVK